MKLPSHYPFPLHLSTAGHSKNRLHPLVKFQPVRVIKFLPAPTDKALPLARGLSAGWMRSCRKVTMHFCTGLSSFDKSRLTSSDNLIVQVKDFHHVIKAMGNLAAV